MISKELLNEVLGVNVVKVEQEIRPDGMGDIITSIYTKINIYELAHLCKEWALTQDEELVVARIYRCYKAHTNRHNSYEFEADTEHEAVFKVCQWIYDEKHRS